MLAKEGRRTCRASLRPLSSPGSPEMEEAAYRLPSPAFFESPALLTLCTLPAICAIEEPRAHSQILVPYAEAAVRTDITFA